MKLLEIQKLCKTYGSGETAVQALKNVSFSVQRGEYVAIVGESGSGKSTLLNMIGALDTPTSGKVLIDGRDTFSMKDKKRTIFRRRNIGFIFQAFNLIPELTVEQNIIFPLLLDYQKPDWDYLEELLAVLNLNERRNHLPSQLSGGQQQRVAIGRALITRPSLILADEPTGNLDSKNSREIMGLLRASNEKYKQTLIVITHDEEIALQAKRLIRIEDGKICIQGEKYEMLMLPPCTHIKAKTLARLEEFVRAGGRLGGEALLPCRVIEGEASDLCQRIQALFGVDPEKLRADFLKSRPDPDRKTGGRGQNGLCVGTGLQGQRRLRRTGDAESDHALLHYAGDRD